MVDVVVAAVDVGQAADLLARCAPHLRHVNVGQRGGADVDTADGVPHDAAATQRLLDILRHLVDEGSGGAGLIGSHVDVGRTGEGGSQLGQQLLQCGTPLLAAHGVAHGIGEGCGVAGHVYLGDDDEAALGSVSLQFGALLLRVVLAGEARHRGGAVELRKDLGLKAEALVVGEVPMEDVHLEARQQVDFLLQFLEADEGAPDIVHEATELEGRIVGHLQAVDVSAVGGGSQLRQRLCSADDTRFGGGRDMDGVGRDAELVAFVGEAGEHVVEGAQGGIVHQLHRHRSLGLGSGLEEGGQERGGGGVVEEHGALQGERRARLHDVLWFRHQPLCGEARRLGADERRQHDGQEEGV